MLLKEVLIFLAGLIIGSLNYLSYFPNTFMKSNESKNDLVNFGERKKLYDERLANEMFNKVKVLCMVMTFPENHKTKALYIKKTWGKRCNKILFMSSKRDSVLKTIVLPLNDTRTLLWGKTKMSFQYAYENHFDDADWFLKADDDS